MTGRTLLGLGLLLAVAVVVLACGDADDGSSSGGEDAAATSPAAARFLRDYVDADGRVVRHDEGGDTVSEGQSYALLFAVGAADEARFGTIWDWTRANLQRDDGLFAWRWADGAIVDDSPAADADLDIAAALALAADRWDRPEWEDEARRIADAVMDHETFESGDRLLLAAGPWAVDERVVNPSYLARCDWEDLAELTGDDRWSDLGDAAFDVLAALADEGLPPDWARATDEGELRPVAGADAADGPGGYGLDAARIPVRLAGCPDDTDIAATLWERLEPLDAAGAALATHLDGDVIDPTPHPLGIVASAAAAAAAGDIDTAERLLDEAQDLHRTHPTYYGAAWIGFGQTVVAAQAGLAAPDVHLVGVRQEQPTTTDAPTTTSEPTTTPPTTSTPTPTTTDGETPTSTDTDTTATTDTTDASGEDSTTTTPGGATSATTAAVPADLSGSEPGAPEALPGRGAPDESPKAERGRRTTASLTLAGLATTVVLGAVLGLRERRSLLATRHEGPRE